MYKYYIPSSFIFSCLICTYDWAFYGANGSTQHTSVSLALKNDGNIYIKLKTRKKLKLHLPYTGDTTKNKRLFKSSQPEKLITSKVSSSSKIFQSFNTSPTSFSVNFFHHNFSGFFHFFFVHLDQQKYSSQTFFVSLHKKKRKKSYHFCNIN